MFTRRQFTTFAAAGMAAAAVLPKTPAIGAELSDDGLHIQDWFIDSFLELPDDLATAGEAGKNFAVIFEQRGCPFCEKTHKVNFAHAKIRAFIPENFDVLQLNLHGSREVVDFDGEALEERALARKWLVNFTPTIVFFPRDGGAVAGKSGRAGEVARLPGYFRPFTFMQMFRYVREGAYRTDTFQNYLRIASESYESTGRSTDAW